MRLNWFSPLPPARGPAADLTRWLLPALAGQADVVVWTTQDEWDRRQPARVNVRRFVPDAVPWHEVNEAEATIYQFDAEPPSRGTVQALAARHAGIAVLHKGGVLPADPLAVVVPTREEFDRLVRQGTCPVVLVERVEKHPEKYAAAIMDLAARTAEWHALRVAHQLARRAAEELSAWMPATPVEAALTGVAREVHALAPRAA